MSELRANINGINVILDVRYSSIGYGYPRIFIEVEPGIKYLNFDLSVGHIFNMKPEDWADWYKDAIEVDEDKFATEAGINLEIFKKALSEVKY